MGEDETETSARENICVGLRPEIIRQLQSMLHRTHSYVSSLRFAKEILENSPENLQAVIHADRRPSGEHERRDNAPTCSEVAVLAVNQDLGPRDILLRHRDSSLTRISETHRSLQYPLIFPRGENGYFFSDDDEQDDGPTAMRFYAYHLMVRKDAFNALHRFGRLMQMFVVDMFLKVDKQRLDYLQRDQKSLRADNYRSLRDAIESEPIHSSLLTISFHFSGNENPANIGTKLFFPALTPAGQGTCTSASKTQCHT